MYTHDQMEKRPDRFNLAMSREEKKQRERERMKKEK